MSNGSALNVMYHWPTPLSFTQSREMIFDMFECPAALYSTSDSVCYPVLRHPITLSSSWSTYCQFVQFEQFFLIDHMPNDRSKSTCQFRDHDIIQQISHTDLLVTVVRQYILILYILKFVTIINHSTTDQTAIKTHNSRATIPYCKNYDADSQHLKGYY